MCGIIGYTGAGEACPILLRGLRYLEYRGYDSSGIAVFNGTNIEIIKKEGRISCLERALAEAEPKGTCGIGHTRWATHGKPSDCNAHPFVSYNSKFAVVHNGIIENYLEIKDCLLAGGAHFRSQTDSEVIAHLLESLFGGDIRKAILETLSRLKGSYALGILCADEPGKIYCVRKDNPLVIGLGDNGNYICSDIVSLQLFTDRAIVLDNCSVACVTAENVEIFGFNGEKKEFQIVGIERHGDADKLFESYMLKEIFEIPESMRSAASWYKYARPLERIDKEYLKNLRRIYFIGCGTALHSGLIGAWLVRRLMPGIDVHAVVASEFRYDNYEVDAGTLTVCVSQSGETADTLTCLRMVRAKGGKVLSVCNVKTSSIAHESDYLLNTSAGPEVAVASTKAYNCQNLLLALFAMDLAVARGAISEDRRKIYWEDIVQLPRKAEECLRLDKAILDFCIDNFRRKCVFYLGRGQDYYTAMECSLKLKEISYIHSEAYAAGELKHGTLALIEENVLVVAIATQEELIEKTVSSLEEVKARGAVIVTLTPFTGEKGLRAVSDALIPLPRTDEIFYSVLSVIPAQLMAYFIARAKGCDADKPRNLAKSVTVE
jgi:glucosamine--fructose-6-phosphate aminotransferase (isomerizing)